MLCETGRLGASAAKDRDSSCTGGWDPYRKVVSTNLRTIGAEIGVLGEAGRLRLSVLSCTLLDPLWAMDRRGPRMEV